MGVLFESETLKVPQVSRQHSCMSCPECKTEQSWQAIKFKGSFVCQNCGISLAIPEERARHLSLIAAVMAIAILALTHLGIWLLIIIWGPLTIVISISLSIILLEIKPPRLERYIRPGSFGLNNLS